MTIRSYIYIGALSLIFSLACIVLIQRNSLNSISQSFDQLATQLERERAGFQAFKEAAEEKAQALAEMHELNKKAVVAIEKHPGGDHPVVDAIDSYISEIKAGRTKE